MPVNILDGDCGIVDQDADRKSQAAKRHRIHRLSQRAEHDDGTQNRQRNRNGNDQSASPAAKKQQDHQRRQTGCNDTFTKYAFDRRPHEKRLIEKLGDL